jgi:O-antigen ligase
MSSVPATNDLRLEPEAGERNYQRVLKACLAALGFFLPFSTAGVNIVLGVLLALCFVAPMRIWRTRPWRDPVLATGLVLLAYISLRTVAADGFTVTSLEVIKKYQELLLLPLFWALMRNARRPQVFANGLMVGSLGFAALYWIGDLLGLSKADVLGNWLHMHRISASFGLAICAFVLFEHARLGRLRPRIGYPAALFLAATVLLVVGARTGHVVMLLLLLCAASRAAPPRARVLAVTGALLTVVAVGAMSSSIRHRVVETLHDTQAAQRGEVRADSSTGSRLEVLHNAVTVAREHWLVGTGWSQYPRAVEEVALRRHADPKQVPGALSRNAHNEYLMQLAAGGLPALLLFIAWVSLPVWRAARDAGTGRPWSSAVGCVALAFAVAALFNSLLLDAVEAHLYAALLAWLLVRRVEA